MIRRGVIPASRGGKLKTLVQAVAIGLFILPLTAAVAAHTVAWVIMWMAVVLTVVTGVDYVVSAIAPARQSEPKRWVREPSATKARVTATARLLLHSKGETDDGTDARGDR